MAAAGGDGGETAAGRGRADKGISDGLRGIIGRGACFPSKQDTIQAISTGPGLLWYKCKGRGATRQSDNILMTSEAMRATGGNMVFNTMSHGFVKLNCLT